MVTEWTIDCSAEKYCLFSAIMRCCNKGRFQQMNLQKNSASPGSRHQEITVSALNVSRTSCKSQRWIETKFKVIPCRECLVVISTTTAGRHTSMLPMVCVGSLERVMNSDSEELVWCVLYGKSAKISEQSIQHRETINKQNYCARCVNNGLVCAGVWAGAGSIVGSWHSDRCGESILSGNIIIQTPALHRVQGWTGPCDHFTSLHAKNQGILWTFVWTIIHGQ